MNKKYIIGIVVVVVILGLVWIFSNQGGPQSSPTLSPETGTAGQTPTVNGVQPEAAAISATGNIDDVAADILSDTSSDEPSVAESDPSLLSENDAAISDFGQSDGGQVQ